jgi:hypothetical protein
MICVQESRLRELIRNAYLSSLSEGVDHNKNIVSLILQLKDSLMKKNLICNTQYTKPTAEKRHRDYGYCRIRIDPSAGRGKSMTPRAINKAVSGACDKLNLNKYFSMEDSGHDGKYYEVGLSLKPKYVQKYLIF